MAGIAYAIAERHDRVNRLEGIAIAAAAFIPPVFLSWALPEGGWAPFPTSAYVPIPLFTPVSLRVPPRREATLRWGVLLYGLARHAGARDRDHGRTPAPGRPFEALSCCAPSGGSPGCAGPGRFHARCPARVFARLPAVVARRAPTTGTEDPGGEVDYFEPLRQFLFRLPDQRVIEIPFYSLALGGPEIGMDQALARGWLRQLDTGCTPIFYREGINRITYASWLRQRGSLRGPAERETGQELVRGARADRERLPYLRLRWKSDDWRVYEVLPSPLVISQKDADIVLEQFQSDELLLDVKRPWRGHRESALDALLVRLERVRGAARRLDEGGRRRGGLRAPLDALRARAAVPARPPLRRLNLPGERAYALG